MQRIIFQTFRHWKATELYHQAKDPHYVQSFLEDKSVRNKEIYINIEYALFDKYDDAFTVKVVDQSEEGKALIEVGFEYFCKRTT